MSNVCGGGRGGWSDCACDDGRDASVVMVPKDCVRAMSKRAVGMRVVMLLVNLRARALLAWARSKTGRGSRWCRGSSGFSSSPGGRGMEGGCGEKMCRQNVAVAADHELPATEVHCRALARLRRMGDFDFIPCDAGPQRPSAAVWWAMFGGVQHFCLSPATASLPLC